MWLLVGQFKGCWPGTEFDVVWLATLAVAEKQPGLLAGVGGRGQSIGPRTAV